MMQGFREDTLPKDATPFAWVCRYYRYLHPGEDRDPCAEAAAKQVWSRVTGDAFAICDKHFTEDAETHQLEILREL